MNMAGLDSAGNTVAAEMTDRTGAGLGPVNVAVRESLVDLRSGVAGQNPVVNAAAGADTVSDVLGVTSFMLYISGASIADGVRVAQGSAPSTSATSPILPVGQLLGPFACDATDKLAVRSNDANTGTCHIIPLV